jgi:hypothetical protein
MEGATGRKAVRTNDWANHIEQLTVFVPAQVRFGFGGGLRLAGLVDGDDPELVPLSLAEARHTRLQLVDGGGAVLIVSDKGIKPSSEFVFLLDNVV